MSSRTPWQVTKSVWYAMFMREALARTTGNRLAAFWLLAEPIVFIVLFIAVRELLGRIKLISGAEFIPWMIVGLMSFFLFRDGMMRSMGAINANKSLFTYRQVKPVDTVLIRGLVELILRTIVLLILILGATLLGNDIIPDDLIGALVIWISIWIFGVALGLIVSVVTTLISGVDKLIKITMFPLMLFSGVMFPINALPREIQLILLYNPILHGVESFRLAFFNRYSVFQGIDILYLIAWILLSLLIGLALHVKFAARLKAN